MFSRTLRGFAADDNEGAIIAAKATIESLKAQGFDYAKIREQIIDIYGVEIANKLVPVGGNYMHYAKYAAGGALAVVVLNMLLDVQDGHLMPAIVGAGAGAGVAYWRK